MDVYNSNISKYQYDKTKNVYSRLHTINSRLQTTVNVYRPNKLFEPLLFCSDILFFNNILNFKIMSNLRNCVNLIGNLGMDPEIKLLESGKKLARFSVATSERYRSAEGEQIKETQWHQVIAWGGSAAIAEKFLKKGKEVALSGRLSHRSYEDKDGNTRYMTEVVVNEIVLLNNGQKE